MREQNNLTNFPPGTPPRLGGQREDRLEQRTGHASLRLKSQARLKGMGHWAVAKANTQRELGARSAAARQGVTPCRTEPFRTKSRYPARSSFCWTSTVSCPRREALFLCLAEQGSADQRLAIFTDE